MPYRTALSRQALRRFGRNVGGSRRQGGGLAEAFQKAQNAANAKNEERYQEILGGYDQLHERTMGRLNSVGDQQKADISERYGDATSSRYNQLVGRGFGNSSLPMTMNMGMAREENKDQRRLAEALAGQRANADMNITQGRLGVIERRSDVGPDPNQLIQLAQGLGQYGRGGGGYGGGGGAYLLPPNINNISPMQAMMPHLAMQNANAQQNTWQYNQLRASAMRRAAERRARHQRRNAMQNQGGFQ